LIALREMPASAGDLIAAASHGGELAGAAAVGRSADAEGRLVEIGLWPGPVPRARFKATSCAGLLAFAELACRLVESGVPAERLDAAALRAGLTGLHPAHAGRANLVAQALSRASAALTRMEGASP
jgi:hypothetical protein